MSGDGNERNEFPKAHRADKLNSNIIRPLIKIDSWFNYFIVTLDTESYRYAPIKDPKPDVYEEQVLAVCDIYDGKTHKLLDDVDKIERYITKLSKAHPKLIVFAHNYFYDSKIMGLLKRIMIDNEYADLPVKIKLLDSIFYVKVSNIERQHRKGFKSNIKTKDERTIEFIDSFNFFKAPLKELLHSFDSEKYASESDYAMKAMDWNDWLDKDHNKENLVQSDTEGLYNYLQRAFTMIPKAVSAPSSVFKLYRHVYLKGNISIPKFVNAFAEKSYRGGRVEAYLLSRANREINYYDFNSLYPYVMKKYKYAYRYDKETNLGMNDIYHNVKKQEFDYLLLVDYAFPKDTKRLPIVIRHNNKLTQKLTAQDVWIVGIEFCDMLDEGASITIKRQYQFNLKDLFSKYVDTFYALKKNAKNEIEKNVYKLFLNSFYGKFGQHRRVSEFVSIKNIKPEWAPSIKKAIKEGYQRFNFTDDSGKTTTITLYDDYISYMIPMEITYNSMIASQVTAYARHENWIMQKELGIDSVIYTDTDSFITSSEHAVGKELGELKLEYKGHIKIYNPKHYTIWDDDDEVIKDSEKGIPKKAIRLKNGTIRYNSFGKAKDGYLDSVAIHSKVKKAEKESDKLIYVKSNSDEKVGFPYE